MELLELAFVITELLGWTLDFLVGVISFVDLFSWKKSLPNRKERKEARKAGTTVPHRDVWTIIFIITTIFFVALLILLLIRLLR